ncbi:MAG: hypothetical protein JSS76_00600 [Bacteroidetes bacterium]|nr:hypothetical protein [Bacteroidota bacterium]
MGQNKSPIPHPIHLRLLMELYLRAAGLYNKDESIEPRRYLKKFSDLVKADKILSEKKADAEGTVSLNLFNKLLGNPYQSIEAGVFTEGIKISILDNIAEKVIRHYKLGIKDKEDERIHKGEHWDFFIHKVAPIPEYFKYMAGTYYKYLPLPERQIIDRYSLTVLNELLNDDNAIMHFRLYFWESRSKRIETACLQIDATNKTATLKYFKPGKEEVASVHRTDLGGSFSTHNSTLHLTFVDEDPRNTHIRTYMCIAIHHTRLDSAVILKGTYITSVNRGHSPVAGELILQRYSTYKEIVHDVANEKEVDHRLYLDLINKRTEIVESAIDTYKDLKSNSISKLVGKIQGAYYFGFLSSIQMIKEKSATVTKGICFIEPNGVVHTKIKDGNEVRGYVNNDIYHNEHTFVISNFFDGNDDFKYHYTLTAIKTSDDDDASVIGLEGVYSGVYSDNPRAGQIFYVKVDNVFSWDDLINMSIDLEKLTVRKADIPRLEKGKEKIWVPIVKQLIWPKYLITNSALDLSETVDFNIGRGKRNTE